MSKLPPLKAIWKKRLDCCCQQAVEVRECIYARCPLFAYRKGKRPKGKEDITDSS